MNSRDYRMPFGKYQGLLLSEIPIDYLEWLQTLKLRQPLKKFLEMELARRGGEDPQEDEDDDDDYVGGKGYSSGDSFKRSAGAARPEIMASARQIIVTGFKALAMKLHPDKGGTNEAMRVCIDAKKWLDELIK